MTAETDEPEAVQLVEQVGEEPTLDTYMDRDPADLSDQDLKELVEVLRADRARFIKGEEVRKAKREGVVLDEGDAFPQQEAA